MIKKSFALILCGAVALSAVLGGCSDNNPAPSDATAAVSGSSHPDLPNNIAQQDANISHDIKETNDCSVDIGSDVFISGSGAAYENSVLSITKGGIYTLTGSISDGYVYIDTEENVKLIFGGFSVKNSKGCALYCYNAKNLYIELKENTENSLEDGAVYSFDGKNQSSADNEPNAALYSKSDLIIYGKGSLNVKGNYGLAIRCNDDLAIEQGTITASAVTNGIRGSDSVTVSGGNITVNAEKDGIKTTNDSESDKGNIEISGGRITVNAGEDGIQAAQALAVSGGEITVTTTGEVSDGGNDNWHFGPARSSSNDDSTSKGIKSSGAMTLSGGKISVNSTDHCVHSAATLNITGGELVLSSSKGKGISSHGDLTVDGGTIDVQKSTEGIESKALFTINGGEITVNATDDGLNSGGGSDMWGTSSDGSSEAHDMFINGGYIYINASGDGIDSNGNIEINGGTVIVNGPTSGGDGALDCGDRNNSIKITGGFLIAAGSLQMAENPSQSSTQNCLCVQVNMNGGETFAVQDSKGNNIAVFTAAKQVQHVVISSPDIVSGESYKFYTKVTVDGTEKNGLYENGAEVTVNGDPVCTLTVSSVITAYGNGGMGGGFGGGGFGGGFGGGGFGGGHHGGNGGQPSDNNTPPDGNGNQGGFPGMGTPPNGSGNQGGFPGMVTPSEGNGGFSDGAAPTESTAPSDDNGVQV